MSKLYRVTAIQTVYKTNLIEANSEQEALTFAEEQDCGWNTTEYGDWYDYQAEEVSDES